MGAISRSFDNWAHYSFLRSYNGTSSGMVHLQAIRAMQAGFEGVADEVSHLAWVQQQGHQEQLTALHRLEQLERANLDELVKANETLVKVSSQLTEVAGILRAIEGTQDEHLQMLKAERTLKEVLFQLTTMMEEMIDPEDQTARLVLCQAALDQLDHHGLGTSDLSDLEDKRAFAAFVKKTRTTARDIPKETQADLLAFEIWHKQYVDSRDLWKSENAPLYVPSPAPQWCDEAEPVFKPKVMKPRPQPRTHPGEHPLPEQFGKMPGDIFINGQLGQLAPYPYQVVAPGTFTPDNVPSAAETRSRFPEKNRGVVQFLDSIICSTEWQNARKFEQALRSWAGSVRAYEQYLIDSAKWEAKAAQFEAERAAAMDKHAADVADFRRQNAERRKKYEAEYAKYEEEELKRRGAWNVGFDEFLRAFGAQGRFINEFLEEHPDIQLVYSKVSWERDITAMRRRVEEQAAPSGSRDDEQEADMADGTARHGDAMRDHFVQLMQELGSTSTKWIECPLCKAEVVINSLVLHYDCMHGG